LERDGVGRSLQPFGYLYVHLGQYHHYVAWLSTATRVGAHRQ
jgi:hypothetical protein